VKSLFHPNQVTENRGTKIMGLTASIVQKKTNFDQN